MASFNENIGYVNKTRFDPLVYNNEPIYSLSSLNISTAQSVSYTTRDWNYNDNTTVINLSNTEIDSFFSTNTSVSRQMSFSSNSNISLYNYTFSISLPSSMSSLSTACIITGAKISFNVKTNKNYGSNYAQVQVGSQGLIDAYYFSSSYQDYTNGGERTLIMPKSTWTHYTHITSSNCIPITTQGIINLPISFFLVDGSIDIYVNNLRIEEIYYIPRFNLNLHKIDVNNVTHYTGFLQASTIYDTTYNHRISLLSDVDNNSSTTQQILTTTDIKNAFISNSYTYNNISYAYNFQNWSALQNGTKDLGTTYYSNLDQMYDNVKSLINRQLYLNNIDMINIRCDKDVDLYLVEPTVLNYIITYNYDSGSYTNTYQDIGNPNANYTILSNSVLYEEATGLDLSKNIAGWTTTSGSTTITYTPEQTFTLTSNLVLYAVWENRTSITFQENGTSLTSTDGTYGTITSNNADASSNGVYYYNQGNNNVTNCFYTLTNEQFYIKEIEITNSDGTTTGLPNGTISNNRRTWSINTWSSNGKNIIINIVLARNLRVSFVIYQPNSTIANNKSSGLFKIYKNFKSVTTISDSTSPHISVMSTDFLNTGDTISFNPKCFDTNQRFYISKFIIPKSTKVNVPYWNGPGNTINSTYYDVIERTTAKNNTGVNYPQITNNIYTEGLYSFTATANYMSSNMVNQNIIYIYAVYEPFNCQYVVCNHNYDPEGSTMVGYSTDYSNGHQTHLCIRSVNSTDYIYTYKFFNDITIQNNQYIARFRNNNNTKHLAYGMSDLDTLPASGFELFKIVDFGNISGQSKKYNYFPEPVALSNKPCDYTCSFLGWEITPSQNAINNYNSPNYLYVNWNPNTYRCVIVIKLPSDEFYPESNPPMTEVTDIITFDNNSDNNWYKINKIMQYEEENGEEDWNKQFNRIYLTKEFFPTDSTSSVNVVFRDIANSGYILKEIRKCSYNGDYASTLSDTTITRNQLDAMTSTQAINTLAALNITRNSPDTSTGSNDKITFNKSNLNNNSGVVDYYFITYEEGLPIFYPDNENDPKRAIQLFWEGTRAIGLYYENTRLL